jgi:hypothetical protein
MDEHTQQGLTCLAVGLIGIPLLITLLIVGDVMLRRIF